MKTRLWVGTMALALVAGVASAQDAKPRAAEPDEDAVPEWVSDDEAADVEEDEPSRPVRTIKVLEHPYQIASFYRQRESSMFAPPAGGQGTGPYALASFYRQAEGDRPYGYSRFWSTGYGYQGRESRGLVIGYRRSIGENGDLFLFAPVFLSPLGPLTGSFTGR